MATTVHSPRQLFGKALPANAETGGVLSHQVDDAIAAIEAIASSRDNLQSEKDRFVEQYQALHDENHALAATNDELTQKLVEAHKIVTVLAQRISLSEAQVSQTTEQLRSTEHVLEAQSAELERLFAAINKSKVSFEQNTPKLKLVSA